MKLRYAVMALCVIVLLGIASTPDYVLDVERENDALRVEVKRATLELQRLRVASMDCRDAEQVAAHRMLARAE